MKRLDWIAVPVLGVAFGTTLAAWAGLVEPKGNKAFLLVGGIMFAVWIGPSVHQAWRRLKRWSDGGDF